MEPDEDDNKLLHMLACAALNTKMSKITFSAS